MQTDASTLAKIAVLILEILMCLFASITSHCLVRQRDPSLNIVIALISIAISVQCVCGILAWIIDVADARILYSIDNVTFFCYSIGFWLPRYFYGKRLYQFLQTRLPHWQLALAWWPVIPSTVFTYIGASVDIYRDKYNSLANLQQPFHVSLVYPVAFATTIVTLLLVATIDIYQLRLFHIASKHLHNNVQQHKIMRQLLVGFLVTLVANSIAGLANMIYPTESVVFGFLSAIGSIFGPIMPVVLPHFDKFVAKHLVSSRSQPNAKQQTGIPFPVSIMDGHGNKGLEMPAEKEKNKNSKKNSGEQQLATLANARTLVMSEAA